MGKSKQQKETVIGSVIANLRYHCLVELKNEEAEATVIRCSMRGKQKGIVCGDRVEVTLNEQDNEGVIEKYLERKNELARPNMRGRKEVLVANIDQLIIVAAVKPVFDPELIDRYLATAELMPAEIILVLNKIDLADSKTLAAWEEFKQLPYTCIQTAAHNKDDKGLEELRKLLQNKTSALVGQSGVGKSSILNALIPGHDIQTQELSTALGEGKHTTTVASAYRIDESDLSSGRLIDSPGVRDFAPPPIPAHDVDQGFIDIRLASEGCKFRDCQHLREPDCAVKLAVENGEITERRYKSYRHLRDLMKKLYRPY